MKAFIFSIAILGSSLASADAGFRYVRCFSSDGTTTVWEGTYYVSEKVPFKPIKMRSHSGVQNGACLFGAEVEIDMSLCPGGLLASVMNSGNPNCEVR